MTDVPPISKPVLWFFRYIARLYFWWHFTAFRISNPQRLASAPDGPIVIYGNHASWWDPLTEVIVANRLMPHRNHYAPMDTSGVERDTILKKIGVFGIEKDTPQGYRTFLRICLSILNPKSPDAPSQAPSTPEAGSKLPGVIWITPQGRFADTRERPLAFRRGIAELALKVPGGCTLIPIAVEYPFWNQRRPEALLHVGEPIHVTSGHAANLLKTLEDALLITMDQLRDKAVTRDPNEFELLSKCRRQQLRTLPQQERIRPAS